MFQKASDVFWAYVHYLQPFLCKENVKAKLAGCPSFLSNQAHECVEDATHIKRKKDKM